MASQANTAITTNTTTLIGNAVQIKSGQMCKGTISVVGTWSGAGATAALVQSKDKSTWYAVKDQSGNAIQFTANGAINYELGASLTSPTYLGITTTNGDGSLSLTVYHDDER